MATQTDFRVKKGLIVGTSDTANPESGTFTYDSDFNTVDLTLDANVNARLAQDHYFYVKAGATITKGDVVYASGAVGASGKIEATPYIANNTIDESLVLGVAAEDIATGAFGYVAQFGSIRGLDASGGLTTGGESWTDGAILYASPTYAGELTLTKPSAPNQDIPIAFVISNNASTGTISVRASRLGYHMDEVHDVEITSIADNDLLVYNNSNSRWENSKTIGDLTLTGELNGPATFYIDPSPHDPDVDGATNGLVVIRGDLQVDGTTTTINSTTVTVDDKNITLASGAANAAAADGAGLTVDDGSSGTEPTILYGSTSNSFNFNRNVGINTTISGGTTADTYLHIYSNESNITPLIKLQNNTGEDDSSEGVSIDFVGSGDKTAIGSRIIGTRAAAGANMDLRFHTARDAFAMIIDQSQQVGLGTTDPSLKLDVATSSGAAGSFNRHIALTRGTTVGGSIGTYRAAANNDVDRMALGIGTATALVITDDDKVGIGTDDPDNLLHIKGAGGAIQTEADAILQVEGTTAGSVAEIFFRAIDINGSGRGASIGFDGMSGSDNQLYLANGGNKVLTVPSNGNVGIGTDSPVSTLDVRSTNALGSVFRKDFNGPVADTFSKVAVTLWGQDHDDADVGTGTDQFGPMLGFGARIDDGDPNTGDVRAGISYSYNGDLTFHAKAGASVADGSYERIRIDGATGNVGIGATDPHANLTIEDVGNNPQVDIYRAVGGAVDIGQYTWTGLLSSTKTTFAAMGFRSGSLGNGYGEIQFKARNTSGTYQHIITFDGVGHILPETTTQDLGSTTQPWQNIYTQDLNLSNEKRDEGNSVDGTKGNWTIQEGDEHLYIINNNSGKKYRFALEEIE